MRRKKQLVDGSRAFFESIKEANGIDGVFVQVGVKDVPTSRSIYELIPRRRHLFCVDLDPKVGRELKDLKKVNFIQGSSFDVGNTFKESCAWVARDSCHCLECTAADILIWAPKVAKGGFFILHDCDWREQKKTKRLVVLGGLHVDKPSGAYSAMVGSEMLLRDFYLVNFEGGTAIWRRK